MDNEEKIEILRRAKVLFKNEFASNHINNAKKLKSLSNFKINPFLMKYIANFLTGNSDPESIAKALVYPRVLGTSVTTTFGNWAQTFCTEVFGGFGAHTPGLDIEFIDQVEGGKKYCQVKAGPQTINKDDVPVILEHFRQVRAIARTNKQPMDISDLVVGVLYGTPEELSGHYKKIGENYPVYVGKEFWHRLTGDEHFYMSLIDAFGEVAMEFDSSKLIKEIIQELIPQIDSVLLK